ncbi:hypothetical protein DFP73DRAFT_548659 [Morchella snyderi]|nr:hypothetical protein DFP73DRAFT_548659 [Morchella snyderi]
MHTRLWRWSGQVPKRNNWPVNRSDRCGNPRAKTSQTTSSKRPSALFSHRPLTAHIHPHQNHSIPSPFTGPGSTQRPVERRQGIGSVNNKQNIEESRTQQLAPPSKVPLHLPFPPLPSPLERALSTMPVPLPTMSKIPRQLGPSAMDTQEPPTKRPSSSSSASLSSRRHKSSPPTSRPTSSSRNSPPQTSRDRFNSSPILSSRSGKQGDRSPPLTSSKMQKQDSDEDTAKMPPPPPPQPSGGRAVGPRTRPGEKRSITGISNKPKLEDRVKAEDERSSVATATGRGIGRLLALSKPTSARLAKLDSETGKKSSSLRSRASTMEKSEKDEKSVSRAKGVAGTLPGETSGRLGRAMSLRSSTKAIGNGNGNNKTEPAPTTKRTSTRPRPVSMYGATSSKLDLSLSSGAVGTSTTGPSHTRKPSISSNTNPNASIIPPLAPSKGHKKSSRSVKAKRPAFTALTQDFSTPANTNPGQPSRSRTVPPPSLDTATMHAQTQLLQLLTLHSCSTDVYQQLISSATSILKSRFEKLSARHYDTRETSLKKQKRQNFDSLAAIVNNVAPGKKRRDTIRSPEERVQAFSEAIKRIDAMRSGEFKNLCGVFGEWIAGYNPRGGTGREKWVDGIGEEWRRECVGISRRLEVSITGVDGVAGVLTDYGEEEAIITTVTRVAEGYKELAEGMLEEVEMMRRMEIEVVERERMELKRRIALILEAPVDSSYNSVAVWAAC